MTGKRTADVRLDDKDGEAMTVATTRQDSMPYSFSFA
jgi:hypothetical protein